jgi:hypothetical protein
MMRPIYALPLSLSTLTLGALTLTGCPDPEGHYEAFVERRAPFVQPEVAGVEGGTAGVEAGVTAGIEAGVEAGTEAPMIPRIESGRFWLGLAPILDLSKPMAFIAEVSFEVSEDGAMGQLISMSLDPRVCATSDPAQPSAGEGIEYQPSPATTINPDGSFVAELGQQSVPGAANCISGSFIDAVITLRGQVISPDAFCGRVTGDLILPFEYTLNGSTFAAYRLNDGDDITTLAVPKSCDDVMMAPPLEGGAEAGAEAGVTAGAEAGVTAGAEAGVTAGAEAGVTAGAEGGMTAGAQGG